MNATFTDSRPVVKSVRRMPYTWQDLQDAAQMFGDAKSDRELEARASKPPGMISSVSPQGFASCAASRVIGSTRFTSCVATA
jgi:hypothetical protein